MKTKTEWQKCFGPNRSERHRRLCVSINSRGDISMNYKTWRVFGASWFVELLYDPSSRRIGIRPGMPATPDSFHVRAHGRSAARFIYAARLLKQFGVKIQKTIRFREPTVVAGVWILELESPDDHRPPAASPATKKCKLRTHKFG